MNQDAVCWGIRTGEVIVYPQLVDETYTYTKYVNGKKRKVTLNKVKLVVKIGSKKILGKHIYEQGVEMSNAISEIYTYYYERFKQSNKTNQ